MLQAGDKTFMIQGLDGIVWFYVHNIASCEIRDSQGETSFFLGGARYYFVCHQPFWDRDPKNKEQEKGLTFIFLFLFPKSGKFWVDSSHHLGSVFTDALMFGNLELILVSLVIWREVFSLFEVCRYVMPCSGMTLTW